MNLDAAPNLDAVAAKLDRVFELAGRKIADLGRTWDPAKGAPVFTIGGRYTTRGWTEWTQGFQYGCALYHFDATGDAASLRIGRDNTERRMAAHVTHTGVHDHGFNNVPTYGNLRRLGREGRIDASPGDMNHWELALRASGAVQAARWSKVRDDEKRGCRCAGFVHSFNGPHSLFADTIRSMRSLVIAHQLGHVLMGENDRRIDLLDRAMHHMRTTAKYSVYYGEGRDVYDTPGEKGRVAHESIFNMNDGRYRCPSTQQGYSPFTTWTRGLAWVLCGFAELLEYLGDIGVNLPDRSKDVYETIAAARDAATATAEWYLSHSFADGMVYWDGGAPGIPITPSGIDYWQPSDPYNRHEPIDSSAAAIAAQGFWRLGELRADDRYRKAALVIADTLFDEPYLATDPAHQGLILHSVYHRLNGWDHVPAGRSIPCGESSMWGDYHALELAVMLRRAARKEPTITFYDRQ